MDRGSRGSQLLAFQRAHGITDSRAVVHAHERRSRQSAPSSPPRHEVHGARQHQQDDFDFVWVFLLAIATGLLFWIASIIYAPPAQRPAPADGASHGEVAR